MLELVTVLDYSKVPEMHLQERNVGFFTSLESFESTLEKYSEHICEETGKYLVVENVEMNDYIFSYDELPIWYHYNYEKNIYEKCDCPKEHECVVGFWQ